MKKYIWPVILILLGVGLQGNMPSSLSIMGAKPDIVLVLIIVFSLTSDPVYGSILGFIGGLAYGSAVGISMGQLIVTRTLTGFIGGVVHTRLFSENPVVPVLTTGWLTLMCEFIFLLTSPRPFLLGIKMILLECAYNMIIAFVIVLLMQQMDVNRKINLARARARL